MSSRQPAFDLLRGVAVVLMIYTHALLSWVAPPSRQGAAWAVSEVVFALPSRLFLLLLGVALALRLQSRSAPRVRGPALATAARRGAELVGLGLVLRLHDYLSHGAADPVRMWKVDILNCMGLATVLLAALCLRRDGRPAPLRALLLSAAVVAAAPLLAGQGAPWPWAPLTAYLFGPRPLSWFPQLPWLAYAACGLVLGSLWQRLLAVGAGRALAIAAALTLGAVALRRALPPASGPVLAVEADPLLVLVFLPALVGLCLLAHLLCRELPALTDRRDPLLWLGQASLPVYLLHLPLCFGRVSAPLHGRLGVGAAVLGAGAVTLLMLVVAAAWPRARALVAIPLGRGNKLRRK